ncbi:fatty-acid amide hydrolase 1-like [Glandiceps talaboti]
MEDLRVMWHESWHETTAKKTVAIGVTVYSIWWGIQKVRSRFRLQNAGTKIAKKKAEVERIRRDLSEKLHTTDEKVLECRQTIVNTPLSELVTAIQSGKYSAVEVLQAFQAKALSVTEDLNCITEVLTDAETAAKLLDSQDEKKGLLHGIPVSFKDNLNIAGYDSTQGISKYIDKPAQEDNVIVKVLTLQGAIPFVKTNTPQLCRSYSCSNPIYGESRHPTDPTRCPCGSSGGEAALIKSHGSILGVGTDIGGSVRIPPHFCGIYGLKPTRNRISDKGLIGGYPFKKEISSTPGPMARDVDSLILFMKALLIPEMFELDSRVPPLSFNDEILSSNKSLCIGYCCDDDLFPPVPSCRRAVLLAKQHLENAGHTLVPFKIPKINGTEHPMLLASRVFNDVRRSKIDLMEGEIVDRFITEQGKVRSPSWLQRIKRWPFQSEREKVIMNTTKGCYDIEDLQRLYQKIEDYTLQFTEEWKKSGLDALITPVAMVTATNSLYAARFYPILMAWVSLCNVMSFPAGSQPVTMVTEEDETELQNSYPDNDMFDRWIKEACKNSVGLPVNVQCITLPWQEEMCLRIMKDIENAVNNHT